MKQFCGKPIKGEAKGKVALLQSTEKKKEEAGEAGN